MRRFWDVLRLQEYFVGVWRLILKLHGCFGDVSEASNVLSSGLETFLRHKEGFLDHKDCLLRYGDFFWSFKSAFERFED